MPYKSDAQRRFFHAAEKRGDISKKTVDEFDKASKGADLPEHVEKRMAHGGMTCPHCGYAMKYEGGEIGEINDEATEDEWTESEDVKAEEAANEPFARMFAHRKRG